MNITPSTTAARCGPTPNGCVIEEILPLEFSWQIRSQSQWVWDACLRLEKLFGGAISTKQITAHWANIVAGELTSPTVSM
jgi:hypothetical protein